MPKRNLLNGIQKDLYNGIMKLTVSEYLSIILDHEK